MNIRKARLKDAEGIARVHVDSWRTTYKGIIPDDYLNSLSYEQRTELWKNNIGKKGNYVLVAENTEEQVIGFTDAWKRDDNDEENSIDLTSIYLLENYQGMGVGKQLLKTLFEHFNQEGYDKVFVEVLEENKTRFFYEYYGASLVKTVEIHIAGAVLKESIYQWESIEEVLEKL